MGPPFPWALWGQEDMGAVGQNGTQVWGRAWREGWDAGGTSGSGGAGSPLGNLGIPGGRVLPDVVQLSAALPPTPHPPGRPPLVPHHSPAPFLLLPSHILGVVFCCWGHTAHPVTGQGVGSGWRGSGHILSLFLVLENHIEPKCIHSAFCINPAFCVFHHHSLTIRGVTSPNPWVLIPTTLGEMPRAASSHHDTDRIRGIRAA